jgi:hypothetical protein
MGRARTSDICSKSLVSRGSPARANAFRAAPKSYAARVCRNGKPARSLVDRRNPSPQPPLSNLIVHAQKLSKDDRIFIIHMFYAARDIPEING